jgi:hypothetical protein
MSTESRGAQPRQLGRASAVVRGRVVESVFERCYCHETTRTGRPSRNCKRCKGKGGVTLIWCESMTWLVKERVTR